MRRRDILLSAPLLGGLLAGRRALAEATLAIGCVIHANPNDFYTVNHTHASYLRWHRTQAHADLIHAALAEGPDRARPEMTARWARQGAQSPSGNSEGAGLVMSNGSRGGLSVPVAHLKSGRRSALYGT